MTIRSIAKAAGVSATTVSRFVNANGFVSDKTKAKLLKIMKANGTDLEQLKRENTRRPASSLKQSNFTILWTSGFRNAKTSTGQNIMRGISDGLREYGQDLVVDYIEDPQKMPHSLLEKKSNGFFLIGKTVSEGVAQQLSHFPVVWLLRGGHNDFGDRVVPDHERAGLLAYEYLKKAGCTRFVCVSNSDYSTRPHFWQSREHGFISAARIEGMETEIINVPCDDIGQKSAEERRKVVDDTLQLIRQKQDEHTGFFFVATISSLLHVAVISQNMVPSAGYHIVSGDTDDCDSFMNDEIPCVDIHSLELGKMAVMAMMNRIKGITPLRTTYVLDASITK